MSSNLTTRLLMVGFLAIAFGAVTASAQLVNPGFDDAVPGVGPVGGFGTVVGPPDAAGANARLQIVPLL